jgi:hypothetical protein
VGIAFDGVAPSTSVGSFAAGLLTKAMETLKLSGEVAGAAGVALGTLLLVFQELIRKNIFPKLTPRDASRLLRLIVVATWTVAVIGIGAWGYVQKSEGTGTQDSSVTTSGAESPVVQGVHGDVHINYGSPPPSGPAK